MPNTFHDEDVNDDAHVESRDGYYVDDNLDKENDHKQKNINDNNGDGYYSNDEKNPKTVPTTPTDESATANTHDAISSSYPNPYEETPQSQSQSQKNNDLLTGLILGSMLGCVVTVIVGRLYRRLVSTSEGRSRERLGYTVGETVDVDVDVDVDGGGYP